MTFVRLRFGTEKDHGAVEISGVEGFRNAAVQHELAKCAFVGRPVPSAAICCANFRGGSEARFMGVRYAGYAVQEEGEIGIFRESRELPDSILADID